MGSSGQRAVFAPVENHREREKGVLVYPVYSRRAGGLSVGINVFPGEKCCSFNCPYCEVFPFKTNAVFSLGQMEADLRSVINDVLERKLTVKDICFSGNGEPSLSVDFPEALKLAGRIRNELVPAAQLVLITNGTGLLQQQVFSLLCDAAAGSHALNIWIKLDAVTPGWYQKINRSALPYEQLTAAIKKIASCAPFTIQTMLCTVDGNKPPPEEEQAWEALVVELTAIAAAGKGSIRKVQIYGKARPSPDDPQTQPLPVSCLEDRAASLRMAAPCSLAVEVYP